ncbi:putative metal-binding motif-containing protein [Myxococcus sp. K15C18031901]|uniref:putative metal-binding motif-containing protein n=1 Tax=Myxococcus dinghuensis TaxID=2906761 RepID=UPI0020A816B6|nr:putative metal-binding motif-containing protein [Myxococcus dinghuensis]MCP3102459.1 putative metal-binding motif-containing protein [Myxococcus dinghuensis]
MRRLALFLLPLLVVACSKSKEQAAAKLVIKYSPGFDKGCFHVTAEDAADASLRDEKLISPKPERNGEAGGPFLQVAVLRKEGWSGQVRVRVAAHEQACDKSGARVGEEQVNVFDLSGEGIQPQYAMQFTTPDADGDGFVDKASGGTDCDDSRDTGAQRYPGNTEVCDDIDNDCDGTADEGLAIEALYVDRDGDGYGTGSVINRCKPATGYATVGGDCDDTPVSGLARHPGKTELCDDIDNNCNNVVDEGFDKEWFLDADNDTFPRNEAPTLSCTAPSGNTYVHRRADGVFDCDDSPGVGARRFPGNPEVCDDIDNDCDVDVDETFTTKGQACAGSCGGVFVCGADQNSVVCNKADPALYYPDVDGDGQGSADVSAAEVCEGANPPAGHVLGNRQDCDDADPKVKVGGVEVCDAIDNNCSGTADEDLACGGSLRAVPDVALGGDGHDWRTVAVGANGYPVWVAGMDGKLVVRKAAGQGFTNFSEGSTPAVNHCGKTDWLASWVDSAGNVYLAGQNGRLAKHDGTSCSAQANVSGNEEVRGMIGFESGTPPTLTVTIYLVDVEGRLHSWVPGTAPTQRNDNTGKYYGIHGLDVTRMVVASGSGGTENPRLWSYWNSDWANPIPQQILPSPANGYVSAVWMGSNTMATAVGTNGRAWRWDGTSTWNQAPAVGTVDFTSVVVPPNPDALDSYVVDKSTTAQLHRLTQFGWAKQPKLPAPTTDVPAKALYDIAATGPGNFWIVGDDGRVWHYPEP